VTSAPRKTGRTQLVLIACAFLGPLAIAAWLYFQGSGLAPGGRSNHGALLEPIINLAEAAPASPIAGLIGDTWLLVYANRSACDAACESSLHTLRQSRLMLGKDMQRLERLFLHGDSLPDRVFLAAEHPGLLTMKDAELDALLDNKRPESLGAGGYFLIDPLGNLVMYFRPEIDPKEMVADIKHLLKLSRIG
jgi:hypothetical protein